MITNKRTASRLLAVVLTVMMMLSMVTVGFTANAAQVEITETGVTMKGGEVLYLIPNSNWKSSGARFACYFFGSGNKWASMTKVEGETDLYEVTVPTGSWTNVIFCRMNGSTTTNSWDNKWNQSGDLVYDGTKNCCKINSGQWDCGTNVTWSVYTPPVVTTTAAPTTTQAPVVTTTVAPVVTDEPEVTTTQAPVVTDPVETSTEAPVATTEAPVVTDEPEVTTTQAPVEVEFVTVYFENNWKWSDVFVHIWGSATDANTEWKAGKLEVVGKTEAGNDIYSALIPVDAEGYLFAGTKDDGTGDIDKTPDLTAFDANTCYYMTWNDGNAVGTYTYPLPVETTEAPVVTDEPEVTTTEAPVATTDAPVATTTDAIVETTDAVVATTEAPVVEDITVYFSVAGWEKTYIYYWVDGAVAKAATPTWPGVEMNFVEANEYGQNVYNYTIPANVSGVVFNNGDGVQTIDITEGIVDNGGFYLTEQNEEGKYNVGTYIYETPVVDETTDKASSDDEATTVAATTTTAAATTTVVATTTTAVASDDEQPTDPVETTEAPAVEFVTVYFENNWKWSDVFVHIWGSATDANTEWKAGKLEVVGKSGAGDDIYVALVPVDAEGYLFAGTKDDGSGNIDQTPDLNTFVANTCYYMTWNDGNAVGTYTYDPTPVETTQAPVVTDPVETTDTPVETSETPSESTPVETSEAPSETTPVESSDTEPVLTETIYFVDGTSNGWIDDAGAKIYLYDYETSTSYLGTAVEAGKWAFEVPVGLTTINFYRCEADFSTATAWNSWTTGVSARDAETQNTYTVTDNNVGTWNDEVVKLQYFVRGTFNEWSTDNAMTQNEDGSWTAVIALEAGTHKFKIGVADWTESYPAADQEFTMEIAGDVTFTLTADKKVIVDYPQVAKEFTVTFVDYDGTVLDEQVVAEGAAAVAPAEPTRDGYKFAGWDVAFDNVTADITVTAQYSKIVVPPTTGTLKIEVAGGTSFTISFNGGAVRPQGASYVNTKAPIGAQVTVVAAESATAEFIGWVNPANGQILTSDYTYTFYTGGNDFIKAMYKTDVESVNAVIFKNDKSNQILDMQYYMAGDEITFPEDTNYVGYDFMGWSMTAEEIQAELAAGNDVVVVPVWEVKLVYINVNVKGGEVIGYGGINDAGQYLANKQMVVEAAEAEEGMKFAYWTDAEGNIKSYDSYYTFYPATDVTLIAVYVAADEEIEYQVLVSMDSCDTTGTYGTFNYSWYVPEGCTFMAAGLVAVNKDYYNEATFVHGTTDTNVWDRNASGATAAGTYNWTGPVMSGQTWYAKAWVQFEDADGNIQVVYSGMLEVVKL